MARGRKRKVPVKRRNEHQRVADAGVHSAADLKQQRGYQHETILKQQQLPDERQKCEYYQSEELESPSVEQCEFSEGLANFTDKLAMLEIKEQHIRTLLGTQFNEESFFFIQTGHHKGSNWHSALDH